MQFEESRSSRSYVGRIDPGDDVVEALTLLCEANDVGAAEVHVVGTLADVEVVRFDAKTKEYVTVVDHEGPFEVVQFMGNMTRLGDQPVLRADALLATMGPIGQQFVFGQLRRATAVDCEFVVHAFTDIAISRRLDAATGRFPIESIRRLEGAAPEPTPRPEPAKVAAAPQEPARERRAPETIAEPAVARRTEPPARPAQPEPVSEPRNEEPAMSWADAVAASEDVKPASQRAERPIPKMGEGPRAAEEVYADYDFEEPILSAGDILDHPKLGECRVIKVEDDDYAHIRLSRGQIRKLALEVVELQFQGQRDGKNVFKVRVRK